MQEWLQAASEAFLDTLTTIESNPPDQSYKTNTLQSDSQAMYVRSLQLSNFRNYASSLVEFSPGRNIIIGDNAQGKTNLLEAIEICSTGRSPRADRDAELLLRGESKGAFAVVFQSGGYEETLSIELAGTSENTASTELSKVRKLIKINGVGQSSVKGLLGRLPVVSFKSTDLNLLRGGPRNRRDWLDSIGVRLRPVFHDTLNNYAKAVAQRNRLLKLIFERGRFNQDDQDELYVWDKQVARFGTLVIKARLKILQMLLPLSEEYQAHLSCSHEALSISYSFAAGDAEHEDTSNEEPGRPATEIAQMEDVELARLLLNLMKSKRQEEIRRKQSLVGPHRDDLVFQLNEFNAVSFASQGQQRSIVLSLKLAELKLITTHINDSPVLLLDDVLAELDSKRQALLMDAIHDNMQTIVTTTDLAGFGREWIAGARIITVNAGNIVNCEDATTQNAQNADPVITPTSERVN